MTQVLAVLFLLAAGGCILACRRNRKMYRVIDRMLDEILDGDEISVSDIAEGEISALASKAGREGAGEKSDLQYVPSAEDSAGGAYDVQRASGR